MQPDTQQSLTNKNTHNPQGPIYIERIRILHKDTYNKNNADGHTPETRYRGQERSLCLQYEGKEQILNTHSMIKQHTATVHDSSACTPSVRRTICVCREILQHTPHSESACSKHNKYLRSLGETARTYTQIKHSRVFFFAEQGTMCGGSMFKYDIYVTSRMCKICKWLISGKIC